MDPDHAVLEPWAPGGRTTPDRDPRSYAFRLGDTAKSKVSQVF